MTEAAQAKMRAWGWNGGNADGLARVVSAHGDYFHVIYGESDGELLARKKSSAFRDVPPEEQPVTGDFVRLDYNAHGESRILEVLPRASRLMRLDPSSSGYGTQMLAVNFDTLFFAMSVNENFSLARHERFRALAADSGCTACVVTLLTKADLTEDVASFRTQLGESAGTVLAVSARTGEGLDAVRAYAVPGRTVAFIGSSGVGKSSLVNALAGEDWMATGEIQSWSGKGRHTTTSRELVMLPNGAMALDTPGLREFGLLGADGIRTRARNISGHRFRR